MSVGGRGKAEAATYSLESRVSLWAAFTEREPEMRRLTLPSLNSSLITFSDSCCSDPGLSGCGVDGPGPDGGCTPVDCAESDGPVGGAGSGGACADG
jgi:hypothetical protein